MITTRRLVLKPYSERDQEDMIELLTNEKIKETFIIPDFNTRDEAVSMFKKLQEYSLSENHYELGIYKDQHLIGFINDVDMDDVKIEIGYVIHPDFHNKGYATEALAAVIEDLFKKGFCEVITGAFISNKASCRVMEKCGMERIDKEEDMFYHDKLHHCIYYSIKKTK
ncbi:acetyltransferase, GNAT family [Clostridium bornimense]|uniref:Acetyltransferase, GNAT family n=1 Tax=Clostridium bornimense TaxID=1216932 RepID=W6S6M5_9CLOT|nr:GNAT family N-acetyltransferase [Clostridium bornimense]CDM70032.1 acetyltransferase, GNAT family [Clostridium bornimense]